MAEVGCYGTNLIGNIQIEFHSALVSDSGQMQHTVGRATESHIHSKSVHQSLFCHNITGTDIFTKQFHNCHTCMFGKLNTGRMNSRDCTVAFKTHTKRFGQAVHRISGIHTTARTTSRAGLTFVFIEFFIVYFAGIISTHRFEHRGKACFLTFNSACKHRTAADKYGRNIDSCRCH